MVVVLAVLVVIVLVLAVMAVFVIVVVVGIVVFLGILVPWQWLSSLRVLVLAMVFSF